MSASSRIVLIGQAPGPSTDPACPIPATCTTGRRICELAGINAAEYYIRFDRLNLLNRFPGKHRSNDRFPKRDARIAVAAVRPLLAGRRLILLGRKVAEVFDLPASYHEWMQLEIPGHGTHAGWPSGRTLVAVVPHTSGRNRWYNDEVHRRIAEQFWRNLPHATV